MGRRGVKIVFLLTLVVLGTSCDISTKWLANRHLQFEAPVPIIQNWLELRYTENEAIAFSMLHSVRPEVRKWIIYPLTTIALIFLITLIWQMRHDSIGWLAALMLILSGAIGNLTERLFRGYVVDFIHLHYYDTWSWPIFNVADILITCGGILLAIRIFKKTPLKPETAAENLVQQ